MNKFVIHDSKRDKMKAYAHAIPSMFLTAVLGMKSMKTLFNIGLDDKTLTERMVCTRENTKYMLLWWGLNVRHN